MEERSLLLKFVQDIVAAPGKCLEEQSCGSVHTAFVIEIDAEAEHGRCLLALVVVERQIPREVSVLHHGLARERGPVSFKKFGHTDEAGAVEQGYVLAFERFFEFDGIVLDEAPYGSACP